MESIPYEIRGAERRHGTTKIEWTEATWNWMIGCTPVSAGCKNCYAMRMAFRCAEMGQEPYRGLTTPGPRGPVWTGVIRENSDTVVYRPLGWRAPRLIFVNSMSDVFHPNAPDWLREIGFDIMLEAPQHRYQVLTKRPDLIAPYLARSGRRIPDSVWLGATVEDERVAERVDHLRAAPARVRFLSVEPMTRRLGRIDLSGIHWVITGGESGPGRRRIDPEWVREVRDVCAEQGVAFFHKQWGHWSDNPLLARCPAGEPPAEWIKRVDPHGKGGAILDGVLWREFPERLDHQAALAA
ncbi:MAG: phage Gp37/Gp68 family protein [Gemmatimonadales bacterium]|nr:phage Gp37/Gp68 family protein [Gemmatimonadales bacterium]